MSAAITGLDHVLVGVADLETARRNWARLGFTVCPRGRHIGWGTANYCLMFERDYIELLGILDPAQFTNNLDRFLETRGEGLLGLAFATEDAEACAEDLRAAGVAAEAPKDLKRLLELEDGAVEPAFRLVHLPAEATPGLSAFVCHHRTPELMRQAAWLQHRNGAKGIAAVSVIADDPGELALVYAKLFGPERVTATDGGIVVDCATAKLAFLTRERFLQLHPEATAAAQASLPALAGITVAVENPAATAFHFESEGLPIRRAAGGLIELSPAVSGSFVLDFVGLGEV
jgi:hypothetical protein